MNKPTGLDSGFALDSAAALATLKPKANEHEMLHAVRHRLLDRAAHLLDRMQDEQACQVMSVYVELCNLGHRAGS